MSEKMKIQYPHLIVCEGLDAKFFMINFFEALFKGNDQFQAVDAGGISDIRDFLKTLPDLPNFTAVKSIIILRDSERDPQGAAQSVRASFKNAGFAVPGAPCVVTCPTGSERRVKVGYALFPKLNSSDQTGTLEDLCLNILGHADKGKILCIADSAVKRYEEQIETLIRPHKNRLHAYLSLTNDFVGLKIGESAKANAFNFLASELEPLKRFLCEMLAH